MNASSSPFLNRSKFLLWSFLLLPSIAQSSSWIPPNDPWLRAELEYLASFHKIDVPISTWPLPINILDSSKRNLSQNSLATIKRAEDGGFSAGLSASNTQPVLTHFGTGNRDKSNSNISYLYSNNLFDTQISSQYIDNTDTDPALKFDNSFVNMNVGRWTVGVGAVDRWWGPGWDSGLILSSNARPVPGLYLSRNSADAFDTKWLSWAGPWTMVTFMGQLEEDRAIPNALLWGMRVAFKPSATWEIGLSRTAMWAGDGRPKDLSVFFNLLRGKDNFTAEDEGKENEPGNQLAGFDFKYFNHTDTLGYSFYGEVIGEDEANGLPSRPIAMFGASFHFSVMKRRTTIFTEFSDTAMDAFQNDKMYGSAYRHGTYTTGYIYKGQTLGSAYDNDSQALVIGTLMNLKSNYRFKMTLRHLNLNRDNTGNTVNASNNTNTVSSRKLETQQISFSVAKTWRPVSLRFSYLWNSKHAVSELDNIKSLADFSVSFDL